ncbi:MAG: dihydrolipoyllysine-residue acetyltransferase [Accumulibacter sp.]|jgi:pyruvate dehydrogenase E2 component (dihydrolipoamide acetyltransferase)|uniref:dihydrolipoyllysine-residue acetyltransferase n=1 Tax=Accumulibacter sp. TaxID=2053492 RepID=UPI002FC3BAC3
MSQLIEVKVPDIGDYTDVPVIDICVLPGDLVKLDDALVTLESDKATMDVPSTVAGVVREVRVQLGEKLSEGAVVAVIEASAAGDAVPAAADTAPPAAAVPSAPPVASGITVEVAVPGSGTDRGVPTPAAASPAAPPVAGLALGARTHASPSVRLLARELGVDLSRVPASGPKGRIVKEDVTAYVKGVMTAAPAPAAAPSLGGGLDLLPWPKVDFAKFGAIEVRPLARIKKISAQNLARNWVMIPAVTYHEDADITDLEAFRVAMNQENEKSGLKITMLAFLIKACTVALKKFPEFNSSLDGDNLVLKQYCHIAFAADTPNGLVVPVIKNADQKSVGQLAVESGELAKKARDGKLTPGEMSGACFTISSLGGIGGTYFSPIINAPEVAILGVNRSVMKPVWNGREFAPRLILPMSLTADHRVIDGALATRFNVFVAQLLADMRRVLL